MLLPPRHASWHVVLGHLLVGVLGADLEPCLGPTTRSLNVCLNHRPFLCPLSRLWGPPTRQLAPHEAPGPHPPLSVFSASLQLTLQSAKSRVAFFEEL